MDVNTLVNSLTQTLDPTLRLQAEQVLEGVILSACLFPISAHTTVDIDMSVYRPD